jgi:hypothetical protein
MYSLWLMADSSQLMVTWKMSFNEPYAMNNERCLI